MKIPIVKEFFLHNLYIILISFDYSLFFFFFIFFFFKHKTAYEIRNCDWSSDVCSSDLASRAVRRGRGARRRRCRWCPRTRPPSGCARAPRRAPAGSAPTRRPRRRRSHRRRPARADASCQIGRAAWRGRGELSAGAGSVKKIR